MKLLTKMRSAANKQEEQFEAWVNFMNSYYQQENGSRQQS